MSAGLTIAIIAVSIALMLVRPKNLPEVAWIGGGLALLLLLGLVSPSEAFWAGAKGVDVYLFLIGMMLLSALAQKLGLFDWVSAQAVLHARGSRSRLFALIYGVGTVVTICLSNDATAVVLTPAVLAVMKRSKAPPMPYLFSCAMIANAASFVLPISNPANLVVFKQGMPPLGRWLTIFTLPSIMSIAITFLVLRWWFREDLLGDIEGEAEQATLSHGGKLVLVGLALVVGVLLFASYRDWELGLPTCVAALVVTLVACLVERSDPRPLFGEISWSTLLLVDGLFVMVEVVERLGLLRYTHAALAWAGELPRALGAMTTAFFVAITNNVVNNLPLGLVVGDTLRTAHAQGLLVSATLIGVDLGPNLSITGSLATILWLSALRKEDLRVGFLDFLKVGAVAMPLALLGAVAGLLVMDALSGAL